MASLAALGEIAKSQEGHREGRVIAGAGGALTAGGMGAVGSGYYSELKHARRIASEQNLQMPKGARDDLDSSVDFVRRNAKGPLPKHFKGAKRLRAGGFAALAGVPVVATGGVVGAANMYRNRKRKEQ